MFLISIFGVKVRGVATPNVLIAVIIFFGGVCQFIAGIMEFISGNTVSYPFSMLNFADFISSSAQLFFPLTERSTYHTL
jgi:succinate-acetate transporter protein